MNEILKKIEEYKLLPVVKIENAVNAVPLGKALIKGGLPVIEITFRTSAAAEAISLIKDKLPQIFLGAGTVLTIDQAREAVDSGAVFLLAPGFNPKVVDYCIENGITMIPGINSPTGIEMALERGLEVVKYFPAEASGGLNLLKAMSAPYSGIQFIPTGGINTGNLKEYISNKRVIACGGTWIVKTELILSEKYDEITTLVKEVQQQGE